MNHSFKRWVKEKDPNPNGDGFFYLVVGLILGIIGYLVYNYCTLFP